MSSAVTAKKSAVSGLSASKVVERPNDWLSFLCALKANENGFKVAC